MFSEYPVKSIVKSIRWTVFVEEFSESRIRWLNSGFLCTRLMFRQRYRAIARGPSSSAEVSTWNFQETIESQRMDR